MKFRAKFFRSFAILIPGLSLTVFGAVALSSVAPPEEAAALAVLWGVACGIGAAVALVVWVVDP